MLGDDNNPYVGPRPFTLDDLLEGRRLFGRDRESDELLQLLIAERIVLFFSPSGAGKTSLIQALLVDKLKAEQFDLLAIIRVGAPASPTSAPSPRNIFVDNTLGALNLSVPLAERLPDVLLHQYTIAQLLKKVITPARHKQQDREFRHAIDQALPEWYREQVADLPTHELQERFLDAATPLMSPTLERTHPADTAANATVLTPSELQKLTAIMEKRARDKIVIFDQFEEILTSDCSSEAAVMHFFEQIGEALADKSYWALFVMREDYVAAMDNFQCRIPDGFRARFRLDLLKEGQAVKAIELPAKSRIREFERDATLALLAQLKTRTNPSRAANALIDPALLQVVCHSMWESLANDTDRISLGDIPGPEEVDRALSNFYDSAIRAVCQQCGVAEGPLRDWFENDLLTPYGYRAQVTHGPLHEIGKDHEVTQQLEEKYLIRSDLRANTTWYELAHDRMIMPLRLSNKKWRAENYSEFQRAAEAWNQDGRPSHRLLAGDALTIGETWVRAQNKVSQIEKDFLSASRQIAATRRWQLVSAIVGGAILCLIAVFAWNYRKTQRDKKISFSHELTQTALNNIYMHNPDPERSMLLALQAALEIPSDAGLLATDATEALNAASDATHIRILRKYDSPAVSIAFSPDNEHFAVKSAGGTLEIVDLFTGEATDLSTDRKSTTALSGDTVAFSRDAVASVGDSGVVTVWDALSPNQGSHILSDSSAGSVASLAFDAEGDRLVVVGSNASEIWTIKTKPMTHQMLNAGGGMLNIHFALDGSILIGIKKHAVTIWDAKTLKVKQVIEVANASLTTSAVSRDASYIALGTDKGVRLLHAPRFVVPADTLVGMAEAVSALAFERHGSYLAGAGDSGSVKVWLIPRKRQQLAYAKSNAATDEATETLDASLAPVYGPAITLDGHSDRVYSLAFSPDGKRVGTASKDHTARIWAIDSTTLPESATSKISQDGSLVAQVEPNRVNLWDTGGSRLLARFECVACISVAFSSDNRRMATSNNDGVDVWNIVNYSSMYRLPGSLYSWAASMNFDASRIAVLRVDGVGVWDVGGKGRWIYYVPPAVDKASAVAIDDSGRYLAYGGYQKTLTLVDLDSRPVKVIARTALPAAVKRVTVKTDKKGNDPVIAVAMDDGTISLRDATGRELYSASVSTRSHEVTDLAISPDRTLVAASSEDGAVVAKVGVANKEFRVSSGGVTSLVFTFDGTGILATSEDGKLQKFIIDPATLVDLVRSRVTRSLSSEECAHFLHATECPASMKNLTEYIEAEARSKEGNLKNAVSLFSLANELDKSLAVNPEETANKIRRRALVEKTSMLLSELRDSETDKADVANKIANVSTSLRELGANKADVALNHQLAIQTLNTGQVLARAGYVPSAIELYTLGESVDPDILSDADRGSASYLNSICWYGTLWGQARDVIKYCSRAVAEAPKNAAFRDSRGLANACMGAGADVAVPDFEAFVSSGEAPQKELDQRKEWIEKLKRGEEVCSKQTLASLLNPQ